MRRCGLFATCFTALHGTPMASIPAGISSVTTLPAPMTALCTDGDAGQICTPMPIQTLLPMVTRLGIFQSGVALCNIEWMAAVEIQQFGPMNTWSPMVTGARVQDHKVMVCIKCTADTRMAAVIDKKRRLNDNIGRTGA